MYSTAIRYLTTEQIHTIGRERTSIILRDLCREVDADLRTELCTLDPSSATLQRDYQILQQKRTWILEFTELLQSIENRVNQSEE